MPVRVPYRLASAKFLSGKLRGHLPGIRGEYFMDQDDDHCLAMLKIQDMLASK